MNLATSLPARGLLSYHLALGALALLAALVASAGWPDLPSEGWGEASLLGRVDPEGLAWPALAGAVLVGLGLGWVGRWGYRAWLARLRRSDIEQARAAAVLARGERLALLGQLAAGVAHELANPLAFAKTNLGWVRAELGSTPHRPEGELVQALDESLQGLQRMERLVAELRGLARGRPEAEPLAASVEAAARLAEHRLRPHGGLQLELAPELAQLPLGGDRLVQVLVNLLVNAADALDAQPSSPGLVRLAAIREGGWAVLAVEDSGPGVPADLRPRLFEPFFTTKPAGRGTGLGLALSRQYVEALGGSLSLEPAPGRGARFVVRLPA